MLYENVELHNIDGIVKAEDRDAVRIQRIPEDLRQKINPGAQQRSLWPYSSEIRLAFDGDEASVTLSSDATADCVVYEGPFRADTLVIGSKPQTIKLRRGDRVALLDEKHKKSLLYSTNIFRLQFGGRNKGHIYLHNITGSGLRPPTKGEVPALRYLAYGTSITQGMLATYASLGYAAQTAWRLGADLINLGMGGSCHCEPEFADYIAAREDWDFATLALSVNMVANFSTEEFSERVNYMVNTIAGSNPVRPVICITLYPYARDLCHDFEDPEKPKAFRQILRDAANQSKHKNLHLIEGADILTDINGLCTDLVHPADNGMINMGETLAAKIRPILKASKLIR